MSDKRLLFSVAIADCEVQTFRSGGKGGLNQNKVNSGVRVIHHPSGARGEARDTRDQLQNKRAAFLRMVESPAFKAWHRMEVARRLGHVKAAEEATERAMQPENLRVEVRAEDGWVEV